MRPGRKLRLLLAGSLVPVCLSWSHAGSSDIGILAAAEEITAPGTGGKPVTHGVAGASSHGANATPTGPGESATPAVQGESATPTVRGESATPTVQGGNATTAVQGGSATTAVHGGSATPTVQGESATPAVPGASATAATQGANATAAIQGAVSVDAPRSTKVDLSASVSEIQQAIKSSKFLSGYSSWSVRAKDNVLEVSTYQQKGSNATDCKIDAVLLGKEIMTKFPQVIQLSMSFYPFSGSDKYKQVYVTIGEISAFGKGLIDQQKLLASLTVEEKTDEEQRQRNARFVAAQKARASAGWTTYHAPGIAFEYPAQWQLSKGESEETIVQLRSTNQVGRTGEIALKLYVDGNKPSVAEETSKHVKNHQSYRNYQQLKPTAVVRFGVNNQLTGMTENFARSGPNGDPFYERHVYFGWPGYVYRLSMDSGRSDYSQVSSLFDHLLGTLRTEGGAGH